MSNIIDVPLDTLFMSEVIKNNTNPDGTEKDKNLLTRMQHPICIKCQEQFKVKYPNKVFQISCRGIYSDRDFAAREKAFKKKFPDEEYTQEDRDNDRGVYDVVFWAERNIVVKDDTGNLIPFKARWYQEETLRCTARHKVDRWGRGLGKLLNLNTLLPTPSGWTTMGEIREGDWIFDADGNPTQVTYISPITLSTDNYELVFSDGSTVHADAEHLWETWTHSARKAENRKSRRTGKLAHTRKTPVPEVRNTREIAESLLHGSGKRIEHNHSIKVSGALKYSHKNQIIDPYVLGAWLGDGSKGSGGFTCDYREPFIVEQIKNNGYLVTKNQDEHGWHVHKLISQLREIRVANNKHIPDNYLHSSTQQRLSLLQGLMDTDGNCRVDGWAEFDNTNKKLAENVMELVTGLGMKPVWSEKPAKLYGKITSTSYRVGFTPTVQVFRLPRKVNRLPKKVRPSVYHRYIVEARKGEPALMRCIEVNNPRHLYLVGKACIPTHNTICGVIEELHKALTRKNLDVLIVCPADSQSEKWYTEIEFQINHSPTLKGLEIRQKQQPFKIFKFVGSGSSIAIFTAGSASGRGANSIRSQDPWRVRLDEQDYLNDNDYKAIDPLIVRHEPVSEFHGSSTPTGVRSRFWQMCTQMPTYREFYFPISVHPNWSEELQTLYRMQAKTDDVYRHEYLAEFSDPISGVFKSIHVDAAKTDYHNPDMPSLKGYDCEKYNAALRYFMGIDWNGKGTGTRIRVVSYDPSSKVRKCVAAVTVDEEGATTTQSIQAIIDLNRKWHCEDIFVDAGFGFAQDELIRLAGRNGTDRDTQKLQDIHTIDFGAQLVFNRLISKRDPDKQTRYLPDPKDEELKRMTKPFMVEGAVMVFEHRLIQFSSEDKILEEQLRSYRVKTYSNHGYANTYEVDGDCGDHDLDAFMLALMAVEQKYGLFASKESYRRLATFSYVPGWGVPSPAAPTSDKPTSIIDQKMDRAGVPSRQMPRDKNDEYRIAYLTKNGSGQPSGMIAPINRGEGIRTGVPSRTSAFKGNPRSRGGNSRGRF